MQVKAIYNHGRLEFVQPMKFKHDPLHLVIEVPDEEVDLNVHHATATMRDRVNAILAPYQHLLTQTVPLMPSDYKSIWHDHLEEKHLGRHEKSDI